VIQLEWGSPDSLSDARTTLATEGGVVVAHVKIPPVGDTIRLLAHELQHVIEHTRGLDLEAACKRPNSGVWRTSFGYETQDAIDVSRRVALELRTPRRTSRR
jgi:hypothetical protein